MKYKFNDEFIKEYSKKIYAFSYQKTNNVYNAEDLSQEILISLYDAIDSKKEIKNINAYVYTICYYTWSKYIRKNKKYWRYRNIEEIYNLKSNDDIENKFVFDQDVNRLSKEISYLSSQHRKIIIKFYFENKSCKEISRELGISNTAVRWHLYDIRKKLKEGIELPEINLSYKPKRLEVGHDGNISMEKGQAGLKKDLLCQNIAIACYGEAKTIEEISRELGVAAAYLECHINDMLYLDYLKIIDKNKYQTNFFIRKLKHQMIQVKYHYDNIGSIAKKIYFAIDKRYDTIKAIGFIGSNFDRDYLLWSLISLYVTRSFGYIYDDILSKKNVVRPKHKDGSEHWVCASLKYDEDDIKKYPKELIDFKNKLEPNAIKMRYSKLGIHSLQLDGYVNAKIGIPWRKFNDQELNELYRIKQLIESDEKPNDNDKLIISRMVDLGYVIVKNEKPEILVPFLNRDEMIKLFEILDEIKDELGEDLFIDYIMNYAKLFKKYVPDFISKEEKCFWCHSVYPQYPIIYYLAEHNYIKYPSDEDAKRICTIVWCE